MYFMVNKRIRFGLLFIIYRRRNIVVCFGTRHISISAVLGQNVFLSLRSVSSLFRLNLCDICMAFIFVPAILSFYAYILHPVTVGFSLRTFPVVSLKWNNSDRCLFSYLLSKLYDLCPPENLCCQPPK